MFKDRILLSGDAANSFHPMAGQGLNLGIGDVMHIDRNIDQLMEMNSSALETYNSSRNQKNIQMKNLHGMVSLIVIKKKLKSKKKVLKLLERKKEKEL